MAGMGGLLAPWPLRHDGNADQLISVSTISKEWLPELADRGIMPMSRIWKAVSTESAYSMSRD